MRIRSIKLYMYLFGLFFVVGIFTSTVIAEEGRGGYAGAFLRMGIGPRALALGDAYCAVGEGAEVGFYNPAGVAILPSGELMASVSLLSLDRRFYVLSFAQPLRPRGQGAIDGGFSIGWVHSGVNNIDGRDLSGNHIGMFSNAENAFYLSFALYPHKIISIGVSGKILYSLFPSVTKDDGTLTSSGFGIDAGILVMPVTGLKIGLVIRDVNSKYTWNTENVWEQGTSKVNKFPLLTRFGLSYIVPGKWMMASADIEHSCEQEFRYHIGLEGVYADKFFLRGGLNNGKLRFGAGFGFELFEKQSRLEYAYISTVEGLNADHVFAWTFKL